MSNVNTIDVAKYIYDNIASLTTLKLQKLLYYSQAWSLVWEENPLFNEEIQAWVGGPVVPEVYKLHKGQYLLEKNIFDSGDKDKLNDEQKDTINKVLEYYGGMSGQDLSDLTHSEPPWKRARKGLSFIERGDKVISHESMAEYYSALISKTNM